MLAEVVGLRLLLPGGARADGSDGAASLLRGYGRLAPLGAASVGGARVGARFDGDSPDVLRALAGAEPRLVRGLGATDRLGFAVGLLLLEDLGLAGPGRGLPSELRDGTGVVFASALAASERGGGALGALLGAHEQLAQQVGARGPCLAVEATCAGTTAALKVAQAFLSGGGAERVLVVTADLPLHHPEIVAAFVAAGAASTAPSVAAAALPFGALRGGLVFGEAAAAFFLARRSAGGGLPVLARIAGLCLENSAHHGSRVDVAHVAEVIGRVAGEVAAAAGLSLAEFAEASVYVAHETFTRHCSVAEVGALERVFGRAALRRLPIVGAKWLTGHCMAAGGEDALAIAALSGRVAPATPAVELDPAFADLRLGQPAASGFRFAMHLSLGFGSQVGFVVYAAPGGAAPSAPPPSPEPLSPAVAPAASRPPPSPEPLSPAVAPATSPRPSPEPLSPAVAPAVPPAEPPPGGRSSCGRQ